MSTVHGLYSNDSGSDDENNRFVGGIGAQGGGSGLAVQPNVDEDGDMQGAIFGQAANASAEDHEQIRRTITMYRDGFTVDDGPFRRLDDPNNTEFLRSLAQGRTPRELIEDGNANVVLGLMDKRHEEYVETCRSFSGQGNSLAVEHEADPTTDFDPSTLGDSPVLDGSAPTTSIQVKLPDGKRKVLKINLSSTVRQLAAALDLQQPFRLVAGFPPKPLAGNLSVEEAELKGTSVNVQNI